MNSDRRAIIQLLAAGRIDAGQAERLLAALGVERETRWAVAACVALAGLAQLPALAPELAHWIHSMLTGGLPAMHRALALISGWI